MMAKFSRQWKRWAVAATLNHQPDVSDPALWCHLVYATFLHLFTENVWVKIMLDPIDVWIQPDFSDQLSWRTFFLNLGG